MESGRTEIRGNPLVVKGTPVIAAVVEIGEARRPLRPATAKWIAALDRREKP